MQDLLVNPAIQAAAAPFIIALLLALIVGRFWPAGLGVAVLGGFFVTAALARGLSFLPLSSEPKVILCSIGLPLVMLVVRSFLPPSWGTRVTGVIGASGAIAALLWITWSVLKGKEGTAIWEIAVPMLLFASVCMVLIARLERQTFPAKASAVLLLAVGSGATLMIAATALYSQLAFALAAGVGAVILLLLVTARAQADGFDAFLLSAASIPVVLLAALSTVFAEMPAWVLLFLALVLGFACLYDRLPIKRPKNTWGDLILSCLWVSMPLIPAIWLALESAGPVSY